MRAVANRVAAEFHRRPRLVPIDETVAAGTPRDDESGIDEDALDCLRGLIAELPSEDRVTILEYYDYSKSEKIKQRRSLAQETARSAGALRVKVYRIRKLLRERLFQLLAEREHAKRIGGCR
jgi:DNA-directed RNA polymerase specialized sigma24 family protein